MSLAILPWMPSAVVATTTAAAAAAAVAIVTTTALAIACHQLFSLRPQIDHLVNR